MTCFARNRAVALVATALLLACSAAAQTPSSPLDLGGFLALRGGAVASSDSWLAGGFGRLPEGSGSAGERAGTFGGELHAALTWQPAPSFRAYVHATARHEADALDTDSGGVAEAFVDVRLTLAERGEARLRGGMIFLPTSRENVGPAWSSPYTLTLSALNSWIADELRPLGVEALAAHTTAGGAELDLLGAAVRGCDTAGALLAWRGWALGSRVSVLGEELPLPPLQSLAPGGAFAAQRDGATEPLEELDGRTGYLGRARWRLPGVAMVQVAAFDNRGDRAQHGDQYAWATRFTQAGAEIELGPHSVLIGEWLRGSTGMGPTTGTRVEADIETWYLLASARVGEKGRLSLRYDRFDIDDRDGTAEPNGESGWAVSGAALWRAAARLRVGFELLRVEGDRPAAAWSGSPGDVSGDRATLEARISF